MKKLIKELVPGQVYWSINHAFDGSVETKDACIYMGENTNNHYVFFLLKYKHNKYFPKTYVASGWYIQEI